MLFCDFPFTLLYAKPLLKRDLLCKKLLPDKGLLYKADLFLKVGQNNFERAASPESVSLPLILKYNLPKTICFVNQLGLCLVIELLCCDQDLVQTHHSKAQIGLRVWKIKVCREINDPARKSSRSFNIALDFYIWETIRLAH